MKHTNLHKQPNNQNTTLLVVLFQYDNFDDYLRETYMYVSTYMDKQTRIEKFLKSYDNDMDTEYYKQHRINTVQSINIDMGGTKTEAYYNTKIKAQEGTSYMIYDELIKTISDENNKTRWIWLGEPELLKPVFNTIIDKGYAVDLYKYWNTEYATFSTKLLKDEYPEHLKIIKNLILNNPDWKHIPNIIDLGLI